MPVRSRWHSKYTPVPSRAGSGSALWRHGPTEGAPSRRSAAAVPAAASAAVVAASVVHEPVTRRRLSRAAGAEGGRSERSERRPLVGSQWQQQWSARCRTPARLRAMPDQGGRRSPTRHHHHGPGRHGLRALLGRHHSHDGPPGAAAETGQPTEPAADQDPPRPPRIVRRISDSSPLRCLYPWASEALLSTLDDFGVHLPSAASEGDVPSCSPVGGDPPRSSLRPPRLRLSLSLPRRQSEPSSFRRSSELINSDVEFAPFTPCSDEELQEWREAAARHAPPPPPPQRQHPPPPVQLKVPETVVPVVDVCAGLVSLTVGLPTPPPAPAAPPALLEAALRPVAEVCAGLVSLTAREPRPEDGNPERTGTATPEQADEDPLEVKDTSEPAETEPPETKVTETSVVVQVTPPCAVDGGGGPGNVKANVPARTRRKAFIYLNQVSRRLPDATAGGW